MITEDDGGYKKKAKDAQHPERVWVRAPSEVQRRSLWWVKGEALVGDRGKAP